MSIARPVSLAVLLVLSVPFPALAAPDNLTATGVSYSQINLTWTDPGATETRSNIERCFGAGCTNFGWIASVGANVTSYSDNGLSVSTTYSYRVVAFNSTATSAYSNTVTVRVK